jgi:NAD(P) transhydrogenase subunit beta
VNIFGGFLVTQRMLPCTRRRPRARRHERQYRALLYLVSGVSSSWRCAGCRSPVTSRQGNLFGMIGMAIAIGTTLAWRRLGTSSTLGTLAVIGGLAIGGGIGASSPASIAMTAMPQLVAAFHSLVGLAAVLRRAGALYAPALRHRRRRQIHGRSRLIEMALGAPSARSPSPARSSPSPS